MNFFCIFYFLQFLIIGCVFSGAGVFLLALMAVDVAVMIFAIRKADGLDLNYGWSEKIKRWRTAI